MRTKKGMAAVIAVMLILVGIVCFGLLRDFDAQGYVRAVLDQTFQGDVKKAAEIMEGADEKALYRQYEEGIETFVANNITAGIEMDQELERKYVNLCKEIFCVMKYNVLEAEKISRKEYHVKVEFQPADVFGTFVTAVSEESQRLKDKAERGEYKGTKEEINIQMQEEFLEHSYEALKKAYQNIKYGEKQNITFYVKSDDKNVFSVEESEISSLITKILGLDEIQD